MTLNGCITIEIEIVGRNLIFRSVLLRNCYKFCLYSVALRIHQQHSGACADDAIDINDPPWRYFYMQTFVDLLVSLFMLYYVYSLRTLYYAFSNSVSIMVLFHTILRYDGLSWNYGILYSIIS